MKWYGILFLFALAVVTANLTAVMRVPDFDVARNAAAPRLFEPMPAQKLPADGLKDLNGAPVVLPEKPFLLVFFAAECPYCKMFHAVLKDVSKDIAVVGVLTRPDKNGVLQAQLKAADQPYAAVAYDASGAWSRAFRISGVPEIFFVGADKTASARYEGAFGAQDYEAVLRAQLLDMTNGGGHASSP